MLHRVVRDILFQRLRNARGRRGGSAADRPRELGGVEPRALPFEAPVQMRPRRASRPADSPEPLALHEAVAELHVEALAVEEGAVESHAMIKDEQIALKREGRARRA